MQPTKVKINAFQVVNFCKINILRPVIKNKFTVWMRQCLIGVKTPLPLAEWDTLNFGLFGSNFVPCERWIKIKVVSEEKMTKSFFLVNKNLYSIKRNYSFLTHLENLKIFALKLHIKALCLSKPTVTLAVSSTPFIWFCGIGFDKISGFWDTE